MSDEDNSKPLALQVERWESLPDGRQQLVLTCRTVVDYATMPKALRFGDTDLYKSGWDSVKQIAFYRSGPLEDLLGKAE